MSRLGKVIILIMLALTLVACANDASRQESKVAIVNWQKVIEVHPEYSKLEQGRKLVADLKAKRRIQVESAQAQIGSLQKLRELRMVSQQSYLEANFATHMVEQREIENAKLQKQVQAVEAEVDALLASRKQAIENTYQLEIFNLRTKLSTVKLKPSDRNATEARLAEVQVERGRKLAELERERTLAIDERMAPYMDGMRKRISEEAIKQQGVMKQTLADAEVRDEKHLELAPRALANILKIMDKEIKKQEDKNNALLEKMDNDLKNIVARLATKNGYEVVFKEYKVNVKAVDLTETVIKEIKNK